MMGSVMSGSLDEENWFVERGPSFSASVRDVLRARKSGACYSRSYSCSRACSYTCCCSCFWQLDAVDRSMQFHLTASVGIFAPLPLGLSLFS